MKNSGLQGTRGGTTQLIGRDMATFKMCFPVHVGKTVSPLLDRLN